MAAKKVETPIDVHNSITSDDLTEILNMELDAIANDPSCVETLPPLLIHGSPGCGKSSIVKKVCQDRGIEFIDVRLAQMEPADIKGLPVPNREKNCMDWFVNGAWPRDPNGRGIIFLDEITAADRSIQVAAYELVLDRRLGSLYSVPPGYLIVAAGNTTTDRAVACTMSSALANRFMHVELTEDAESWLKWARANDIHPAVIGYITFKNASLFNMEGENLERGWPSPRSWERVSKICHLYKNSENMLLRKMVFGLIGQGIGVEFMEFWKINAQFDNVLELMLDPNKKIKIPDSADQKYALCSTMVYLVWKGKTEDEINARVNGFYRICIDLPSDFATMALSAALEGRTVEEKQYHAKKLTSSPQFKIWREKHGKALKKGLDLSTVY